MPRSQVLKMIVKDSPDPIDGVLGGIRALWQSEAALQEGQEHIEAVRQGLVPRLPYTEIHSLRHPVAVPFCPSCGEIGRFAQGKSASGILTIQKSPLCRSLCSIGKRLTYSWQELDHDLPRAYKVCSALDGSVGCS